MIILSYYKFHAIVQPTKATFMADFVFHPASIVYTNYMEKDFTGKTIISFCQDQSVKFPTYDLDQRIKFQDY